MRSAPVSLLQLRLKYGSCNQFMFENIFINCIWVSRRLRLDFTTFFRVDQKNNPSTRSCMLSWNHFFACEQQNTRDKLIVRWMENSIDSPCLTVENPRFFYWRFFFQIQHMSSFPIWSVFSLFSAINHGFIRLSNFIWVECLREKMWRLLDDRKLVLSMACYVH